MLQTTLNQLPLTLTPNTMVAQYYLAVDGPVDQIVRAPVP